MRTVLIINADDFGLCSGVNNAVQQAHTTGILTSASIMPTMPAADDALKMAAQLPDLGIGLHLNLTEGWPVSQSKKIHSILDKNGMFTFSPARLAFSALLRKNIRNAVKLELTAQIEWLLERNIKPTHLDSHKHIHACPSIYPVVVELARKFNISAIRWPCEPPYVCNAKWPTPPKGGKTRAFILRRMAKINRLQNAEFIKNNFLFGIAHTGQINKDFFLALARSGLVGTFELMTHPGFADGLDQNKTRLLDQRLKELETLCSREVKNILENANIQLTHYGKL